MWTSLGTSCFASHQLLHPFDMPPSSFLKFFINLNLISEPSLFMVPACSKSLLWFLLLESWVATGGRMYLGSSKALIHAGDSRAALCPCLPGPLKSWIPLSSLWLGLQVGSHWCPVTPGNFWELSFYPSSYPLDRMPSSPFSLWNV